jgi:methylenetetrahydrofolate dehydrogenase (NADP+) / methenyltetrahydrofolate cyclohydrolase
MDRSNKINRIEGQTEFSICFPAHPVYPVSIFLFPSIIIALSCHAVPREAIVGPKRGGGMAARIIDGKAVSEDIRRELAARTAALKKRGVVPGLAVILVGDDPASLSYVTGKERSCAELGIASLGRHLPADTSEAELIALIKKYNADPAVHGILVQIPLPKHISERRAIDAIDPDKDMDGLTPTNVGRLVLEEPGYLPCTPAGVLELLARCGVRTKGASAVVVGRSNLVGRPLANLLVRRSINATLTLCHTGTVDLAARCREADILIACAGSPGLIKGDMVKRGACVIDVGMTRVEDPAAKRGYRLVGDVEYAQAAEVAGWITPVPGGVGPMTVTMLLSNTVTAAERSLAAERAVAVELAVAAAAKAAAAERAPGERSSKA